MSSWFITNLIAAFLLPPLSLLLLLAAAIVLLRRRPKTARLLLLISFSLLWLCSTPYIADSLLRSLESRSTALNKPYPAADAVVILGGGSYFYAPEYDRQDTVGEGTLPRLRFGARLYRETAKPILVSGGKPLGNTVSEAQQMRVALEQDFRVPVRWTEDSSDNTYQNAYRTLQILHSADIRKIYLVTSAWHMPRAAMIFRKAGFTVVEAPVAYTTNYKTDLLSFIPQAEALRNSRNFMREIIGMVWYRLRLALSDY